MQKPNIHSEDVFERAYAGRTPSFYSTLLSQVVRYGKPGRTLDLGAGLGLFAELAHQWGLSIAALEGSSHAVEKARERAPELDISVHDLGGGLPFPDLSFCNVVLNQVVEHLDSERFATVLSESWRVLAPDGRIFVYSPSRRNMNERTGETHVNLMLPSELRRSLETAGFKVVHEPNAGFWFSRAEGLAVQAASKVLMRVLPYDWVSATANAIGIKDETGRR